MCELSEHTCEPVYEHVCELSEHVCEPVCELCEPVCELRVNGVNWM